jgi:cation transport regulator ChaB
MPKSNGKEPKGDTDVPSTIERSDRHAQEIYTKAHDSAVESYGEGERAHRTAFAALKHSYEKVGDHWEAKDRKGPSDRRAARGGQPARDEPQPTAGGVDANASKKHLRDVARRRDVPGRSKMDKDELVAAIQKANDRATANARGD